LEATMYLHPIPALKDNYIWLMHDAHGRALIVDPGEAQPVLDELEQRQLDLQHILLTHHHPDHTAGVDALVRTCGATVTAPDDARIRYADQRVGDGDVVQLPEIDWRFNVLFVPGHTRSHVAYFGEGILFSGDTLFSLGCGRL